MKLHAVTDPELLKQLGTSTTPVTDEELLRQLNGAGDEDPGTLKSAAAGLMSGVPLAETAIAGVKSAIGDKTYDEEHKALEDLKDNAWKKHPVAYGAGKVGGIAGTGLVAPESLLGRLGMAAAQGAGYGADEASSVKDIPLDALKGAGMGAAVGGIGEGVGAAIKKLAPAIAKGSLAALLPHDGKAAVEARLANPAALDNAIGPVAASEKLAGGLNSLRDKADELGTGARQLLDDNVTPASVGTTVEGPEVAGKFIKGGYEVADAHPAFTVKINDDTLSPIVDEIKGRFTQNGVPTSSANEAAVNALDSQYQRLVQMAKANGGTLSEVELKKVIVDMQQMLKKNVFDNPDVGAAKDALKQLSGALNGMLKESNPSYAEAMVPDAKLRGMISEMKDTFKPDINDAGDFINSDTTNTKLSTILNENKSNAQEALNKFSDLTGFDFLKNAKDYNLAQAFETGKGSSEVKNALTLLGYGAGHMAFPFPGGGILGAAAGRIAGTHIDGGQIAKKLIDKYLSGMQTLEDSGLKAAYQKYGPLLVQAAKAGGNNLAATHFVLATSNPDYQHMMQDAENQPQ
jgi:X-X-X-Leu-X-X-Gly heptad repeat protein